MNINPGRVCRLPFPKRSSSESPIVKILTVLAMLAGMGLGVRAETQYLVLEGKPQAEIVISAEPARMTRFAAKDLQEHIEKISGARLPIVTEPSGDFPAAILVGVSDYTEKLGIEVDDLRFGAYRMVSGDPREDFAWHWLALVGPDNDFEPVEPYARRRGRPEAARVEAELDQLTKLPIRQPHAALFSKYHESLDIWEHDDRGTYNAVCGFLRDLGVRWYFPGEIGEIIPQMASIPLPEYNDLVRPDFEVRQVEFWGATRNFSKEDLLWSLRMGIFEGYGVWPLMQVVHGMKFVHGRDEYKEMFPHHFAIWRGEPQFRQKNYGAPNLNAEGLLENHVEFVRFMFDHFGESSVSIDPPDGFGAAICETQTEHFEPERGRGGSMSNYVWGYMNEVAKQLYKTHPDRMVNGLAYSTYQHPPTHIEQMSPNMAVLVSSARVPDPNTREMWRQLRKQWLAVLPSKKLYATGHFYAQSRPSQRGVPEYFPRLIAENLRELKEDGVRGERAGVYTHSDRSAHPYHEHAIQHLNLYVTFRLWWDVNLDVEELLEEYYQLFYGPAAKEMKAFIEYSEQHYPSMYSSLKPVEEAQRLLNAAVAAAPAESIYAERIQLAVDYVLFDELIESISRTRENVPRIRVLGREHQWQLAGKTLDGRLDGENYWPPLQRFHPLREIQTGGSPSLRTRFRITLAPNTMFIGIYCEEPDMENLNFGDPSLGDEGIRKGDYVEILLETSTHSYYRISLGANGVIVDADCGDGKVNTEWTAAADAAIYHGDGYWTAEIRLPLPGPGTRLVEPWAGIDGPAPLEAFPWYFNIGRQRVRDGEVQRFSFSPTESQDFEVTDRFAEMWSKYGR